MKELPLSTCEKNALRSMVAAGIRHDHREFLEARESTMSFGRDFGSCTVTLGETRVLAQVTCEVVEPVSSRPNEGKLRISVHMSQMAAPHIEQGRNFADVDALQQVLDRNIKDSRCVDLESLCIMAEESVWMLKVDVTILNHGGNLCDAANLAAVAALRHFHRPDVSVEEDGRVTILSLDQSPPVPTFMKKVPVCVSYALINLQDSCVALMDPTHQEERVMTGRFVAGLNPHGDITSLVFPGRVALQKSVIMSLLDQAFVRAKSVAERVQKAVDDDLAARARQDVACGYKGMLKSDEHYKRDNYKRVLKAEGLGDFIIPTENDNGIENSEAIEMNSDSDGDDPEMSRSIEDMISSVRKTTDKGSKMEGGIEAMLAAARKETDRKRKSLDVSNDLDMSDDEEEEEVQGILTSHDV